MKGNKLNIVLFIVLILVVSYFASGNNIGKKNDAVTTNNTTVTEQTLDQEIKQKEVNESIKVAELKDDHNEDKAIDTIVRDSKNQIDNDSSKINEPINNSQDKVKEEHIESKSNDISNEEKDNTKQEAVDKYLTSPVPQGKPEPVEWQDTVINKDNKIKVTLSVTCNTILDNMDRLDKNKVELVPKDGVIYAEKEVLFDEGESVFDVLLREMQSNKIHMEFVMTPMYNSNYIEGINNLYEFDCGELSGWMYKVNGWFPNYGCSRYMLEDGDKVEWVYTCDLGRDVGHIFSEENSE